MSERLASTAPTSREPVTDSDVWRRGLYRMRQSWLSMAGLLLVLLLLLLAVIGGWLAPYPRAYCWRHQHRHALQAALGRALDGNQ